MPVVLDILDLLGLNVMHNGSFSGFSILYFARSRSLAFRSPLPTGGNVDCEQQPSRSRSSLDTVDTMAGGCFGRSFRDCISPFSVPRTSEVLSVFTTPATNQIPQKYKKIFTYDPLYDDDDEKDCKLELSLMHE